MTADGRDASPALSPLDALHRENGASLCEVDGWLMPWRFPGGSVAEHLAARSGAALFDLSSMGLLAVRPRNGRLADAAAALELLTPSDIIGLPPGRVRYAVLTSAAGTIEETVTVAHAGDHLRIGVDAGRTGACRSRLAAGLGRDFIVDDVPDVLIALQGPRAEAAVARLAPAAAWLRFMDTMTFDICGARCLVSRFGITGEDGFELALPAPAAAGIVSRLLESVEVQPSGLGARETLRLEAGHGRAGIDFDCTSSLAEAGLAATIGYARRPGGVRQGGFPGADVILAEVAAGASRSRVGFVSDAGAKGQVPLPILASLIERGAALYPSSTSRERIGHITSVGYGPSVEAVIAMGYVPAGLGAAGSPLFCDLAGPSAGQRLRFNVAALPLVPPRMKLRAPFLTPAQCAEHDQCEC